MLVLQTVTQSLNKSYALFYLKFIEKGLRIQHT